MPRQIRYNLPGIPQHVIQRGNNRQATFFAEEDYLNHTYQRTGTLWEGRYKAALIDSERYVLTCYRYIELNPVRAEGMVEHPGEYRWSSYRANALGETDVLLKPHPLDLALGASPQVRQTTYRALFDTDVDEHSLSAIRESLNHCRVLGSEIFKDQIEHALARRVRPGILDVPKKHQSDPCF